MNTANGNINREDVHNLQDLLDAVPPDRTVACLPTHESLILHDGEKELGRIPLDGVVDVSLLDDSSVQKRYTVGRSLLLGPLVLLFPKKIFDMESAREPASKKNIEFSTILLRI